MCSVCLCKSMSDHVVKQQSKYWKNKIQCTTTSSHSIRKDNKLQQHSHCTSTLFESIYMLLISIYCLNAVADPPGYTLV